MRALIVGFVGPDTLIDNDVVAVAITPSFLGLSFNRVVERLDMVFPIQLLGSNNGSTGKREKAPWDSA